MKWLIALLVISLFMAGCGDETPPVADAGNVPAETADEAPEEEELPEGIFDDETLPEDDVIQEVKIDGLTQEDLDNLGAGIRGITTDDLGGLE